MRSLHHVSRRAIGWGTLVAVLATAGCVCVGGKERHVRGMRAALDDLIWQQARLEVKRKHDETISILRSFATGLGSYQVDHNFYPLGLPDLEKRYMPPLPARDAWSNDLRYAPTSERTSYLLTAPGQDGVVGSADDYAIREGVVTHQPDVRSLHVEPLPLPGPEHRP